MLRGKRQLEFSARTAVAAGVASWVPSLILVIAAAASGTIMNQWTVFTVLVAWVVTAGHLLILGLPAFLVLRWRRILSWRSLALCGFLAGCLPVAVLSWPLGSDYGYTSGGNWFGSYVIFYRDGVPSLYGWLRYVQGAVLLGLLGLACALAFWRIWLWLESAEPNEKV